MIPSRVQSIDKSPGVGGFAGTEIAVFPPKAGSLVKIVLTFTPQMVNNNVPFSSHLSKSVCSIMYDI